MEFIFVSFNLCPSTVSKNKSPIQSCLKLSKTLNFAKSDICSLTTSSKGAIKQGRIFLGIQY